jgi:hypothetical protein
VEDFQSREALAALGEKLGVYIDLSDNRSAREEIQTACPQFFFE